GLGGYPGSTVPGAPGQQAPGQLPTAAGPAAPVQAPRAGQSGPVAPAGVSGGTLAHVPVV
ncbi:MAG: phosphopeptide-binding protein, partial [Mycobacterium sp.]